MSKLPFPSLFGDDGGNHATVKPDQDKNTANAESWFRLARDRRWSSLQKMTLIKHFQSAAELYAQTDRELRAIAIGRWQAESAQVEPKALQNDLAWFEHNDHHLICYGQADYPELLTQLPDPPIVLFAQGDKSLLHGPAAAIVGSRQPTPAGRHIATQIAAGLAASGMTITSGMALGVDGAAHQGALNSNGSTVAVMGCGLDIVYPARHRDLFNVITNQGCVVSEYPLGMPVSRYTFPQRNRIVSGLSLGTLIVEAAKRSGTLITARLAMEQNRSVMVVPGSPLSRQYQGSHALLQQGASLVTSAEDVLVELQQPLRDIITNTAMPHRSSEQQAHHRPLLSLIYHESTSVESIISASGLTTAEVSSMLLTLEVEGLISRAQDGGYVKLTDEKRS